VSRLHKEEKINLVTKYYIIFAFLFLYGFYKNGLSPLINGYGSNLDVIRIILIPIIAFLIGFILDKLLKNNDMFNNTFYSLLFSLYIPYKTNIVIFSIFLIIILCLNNFILRKKDFDLNFIVVGKLALVLCLYLFNTYSYQNPLEASGLYQYSFIDQILGRNVSGLFTSNVLLLVLSYLFLFTDEYYKKEIPIYSYGIYLIMLMFFSIIKKNMSYFLLHICDSNVLFALIFISTLSLFSPYTKKRNIVYGILIGVLTVPLSLLFNVYEGVYIAILIANLLMIILKYVEPIIKRKKYELLSHK
jgi:hypothetical protein